LTQANPNGWPFETIEHWPPMTYRDRAVPTGETMKAFTDFLKTENSSRKKKQLQPWIPFCEGKCNFCYFPVDSGKQNIKPYITAMKKALTTYAKSKYVLSSVFDELYIGGGSPTVLENEQITDLLTFCRSEFSLSEKCFTKFTACTNNLTEKKIELLASEGVNQLDIGIQTFNEALRRNLAMRDTGKDAIQKLQAVKKHGLMLSIDLLYNIPGQTVEQWRDDLKQALELQVESVDCYPLDLYSGTSLSEKVNNGELPSNHNPGKELELYLEAYNLFKKNGYQPTCHNRFSRIEEDLEEPSSEVIGTGAGFFMGHLGSFQYSDIEAVKEYTLAVQNGVLPLARIAELSHEDEMRKAMMLVYIRVPVERESFRNRFGKFPEEAFPRAISSLKQKGLIDDKDGRIALTEKGDPWRFNVAWEFFTEKEE
jgi:coproporphyrinogen III oxidase-like Fe-S oxidoreductase